MDNATDIRKTASKRKKPAKNEGSTVRSLDQQRAAGNRAAQKPAETVVSPEERQRLIAETAYFRAQQRGFNSGDPLDDWLAAERQINQALPSPQQQKQEWAAYTKMRETMQNMLAEVRGSVSADTLKQAYERTTGELKKTGEYTADTVNKIGASLRKDMASAANKMGPKWEAFSDKTSDLFSVWRDRGGLFIARAADGVAEWLQQAGNKKEQQTYEAGDMVYSGTFECTGCGEHLSLHTPSHLPPCPTCRKLEYRRLV